MGDKSNKADAIYDTVDDLPDFITYVTGVDESSHCLLAAFEFGSM